MKIIYFLSVFCFAGAAFAQDTNDLRVESSYAIDLNSSWNIKTLDSIYFKPFSSDKELNIGYNINTSVWCAFKVKNHSPTSEIKAWLCFDNCHLDSLVLFEEGKESILGDRTNNATPFIHTLAFEIVLEPNEEREFFVKVKKEISFLQFSFRFADAMSLVRQSRIRIVEISFFVGVAFLLILFNSMLFYITRKKLYLYYILYSTLSIMYIMITSNFAKNVLFPNFLSFGELRVYLGSLAFMCLTIFLSSYLNLKTYQPGKNSIIFYLNIGNCIMIGATIILLYLNELTWVGPFFTLFYVSILISVCLIAWSSYLHLKIDRRAAIYVLAAFSPSLFWILAIVLKSFQILPRSIHEDRIVILNLYEVFLFGYVLTMNYMATFKKNNELIVEIISEKEKSLQAVTQVQVRERRNIANIIHDNVGSKIAYILQLMQLKKMDQAHHSITELASDIREISHRIMPKSLDEGALTSSLQNQIESLNESLQDAKIELACYDFPERINEAWIYDLYLITLEIINNAIKHGLAKSVNIEFYQYSNSYLFQFTDDGVGFDPETIPKGFGLKNIEERVHYYHGTFELNSHERAGTIIQISIAKS